MKISKEQLAEELRIICRDEFEAIVSGRGDKITLQFHTGQKFIISIE